MMFLGPLGNVGCSPSNSTGRAGSSPNEIQTMPNFKGFIAKFKILTLPFNMNTSCYAPDSSFNTRLNMKNDSVFIDYVGPAISIGILPDTSRFYKLIYCTAAACYTPVLAVFSKDGKVISRELISEGCGSEPGYSCKEELRVESSGKVVVEKTEESFKVDARDQEIPGSRKGKSRSSVYSIRDDGTIMLMMQQ